MVRWQALRLKPLLPLLVVAQLFIGVGTVIGLGYLLPEIDPASAMYLTTGGPTLTLVTLGLVMVPQTVTQAKAQGTFDYMWALPVPRLAFLAADLTLWLTVTLPGVVLALVVGTWRYGFALQVSPWAVPACLLVALTATTLGYAMAHLAPRPELVIVLTNLIVFCLFLFSPINFPVERLPGWLATLHRFLPVKYAADAVRGSLTGTYATPPALAFGVLGAWCLLGFGATFTLVTRRR
jgi:ABC-2 type transport system permease protein